MWRATFDTKAAARRWAEAAESHLDHGHVPDCACQSLADRCAGDVGGGAPVEPARPLAETLTLAAWRERWWPTYCRSTRKAPRGIEETDRRWRLHIEPRWGDTTLAEFDRLDIQDWVDEELAGWKSPAYVELIYKDLHLLFTAAVDNRPPILGYNPCYKIRLPDPHRVEVVHTDPAGVAAIAERCGPYADLVWCLYGTGWRWAEMVGLRRDLVVPGQGPTVDPDAGVLRVHPDLGCLIEARGGLVSGPPKTRGSARETPVPPFVMDMVLHRLEVSDGPYVFYGPRGGLLRRSGFGRRVWRPACDGRKAEPARRGTAGHPAWEPLVPGLRVHGLRHSHKALLEAALVPDSAIEIRLGHAGQGPAISRAYSHVLTEVDDRIVKVLQSRYEAATAA